MGQMMSLLSLLNDLSKNPKATVTDNESARLLEGCGVISLVSEGGKTIAELNSPMVVSTIEAKRFLRGKFSNEKVLGVIAEAVMPRPFKNYLRLCYSVYKSEPDMTVGELLDSGS